MDFAGRKHPARAYREGGGGASIYYLDLTGDLAADAVAGKPIEATPES
jgi:hypothetical protein